MFWGLIIEPGKKYSQTVENSFHVSKACLDLTKGNDEDTSLILEYEGQQEFILCHLNKSVKQESLDLNFQSGDSISLFSHGQSAIHLTGYLIPEDEDDMTLGEMMEEQEEEEEDDQDEEGNDSEDEPSKGLKRAIPIQNSINAKKKKVELDEDEEEEDDDEEGEEEEEEEEEEEKPSKKPQVKGSVKEQKGREQQQQQQQQNKEKMNEKGGKKKNKNMEQAAATSPGPKAQKSPSKRTLPGGLVVEDLKVGNGPEAKSGKNVAVYYTGRLQKGNKQFDQTNKGPGFKFRLGAGEVIKGWDQGVAGMKVGGKRRLIVPAHMAYGAKGSPPEIPPNSTLVFDVELKSVQ